MITYCMQLGISLIKLAKMQSKTGSNCYRLSIEKRRTVFESVYIEKLDTTVRLLVAVSNDLPVILDYLCNECFDGNLGKISINGNFKLLL